MTRNKNKSKKINKTLTMMLAASVSVGVVSLMNPMQAHAALEMEHSIIDAGSGHSFAFGANGTIYTWGYNYKGALGDGTTNTSLSPKPFTALSNVQNIEGTLALKKDGTVWAWGDNTYGQLGNGTKDSAIQYTPIQVSGLSNVVQIESSGTNSAVLKDDGTVWVWGSNINGQIGNNTLNEALTPVQAQGLSNVIQISLGNGFTTALKDDGTVWAWGNNYQGQMGSGQSGSSSYNKLVPTQVAGLSNVKEVRAGQDFVAALKNDGTVWVWGNYGSGQTAQGVIPGTNPTAQTTPVQAKNISNVKDLTVGLSSVLVLKEDGTVWGWGNNYFGNLGDGSTTNRSLPVQVKLGSGYLTGVSYLDFDASTAFAVMSNGSVYTWGSGSQGQLGIGRNVTNQTTPVVVTGLSVETGPDTTPPEPATFTASTTSPTNKAVTVTINYPSDATTKEYKIGVNGSWQTYSTPVAMNANDTIYARSQDSAGNQSVESNYTVSNIDMVAPTTPTLVADKTTPTNGNVVVTVTYPSDTSVKEYRINGGAWTSYTSPITVTANGTVEARATDAAGNVSTIGSISVTNIDKVAPTTPTLSADKTTPTNQNVTVTITFSADSATKEYRVNGGAWTAYTTPVAMTANGLLEARGTDSVGNVSTVGSYTVSNIDTTAPTTPTLSADKTTPTNTDVKVTITYPSDSAVKEYRVNGGSWTTYATVVTMSENGTVEARTTDAAGNVSGIGSLNITNIDKTVPTTPTLTADKTNPTNGNVTVTISFSGDSATKQYRINGGSWTAYTAPVAMTANGTVEARGTNSVGNVSAIGSYTVNNIDKTAPTVPTFTADVTSPTTGRVTVTVTYPSDASVKEVRVNGGTWMAYSAPIEFSENGTVEARATDAVGNVSTVGKYNVTNITEDTITTATFTVDKTTPTNGAVKVTISYPSNASMKEYKIGVDGAWTTYTAPVQVSDNATIYARGKTALGTQSAESSYEVNNIDKIAPEAPTLTADVTTPTTGTVKVSVSYPADAATKQYKLGASGTWQTYSSAISLTTNNTVYARAVDSAGNISTESNLVVSNISKSVTLPPTTFSADVVTPTNGNVTLTINYPSVATIMEYKLGDNGTWSSYTAPLVLTENTIVYARSQDEVGNKSNDSSYSVNNIDKEAPTVPTIKVSGNQLTISSGTDNSGSVSSRYKINNASWTAYAGVMTLDDGQYTVQAKAVDQAGNESTVVSSQFVVYVQALKTATDAVKAAEASATQDLINTGYDMVNTLPDVPEKQALLDRLDKLVELWMQAEDAVTYMESTPIQANVDTAKTLVAKLPDSPEKTDFLNRIKIVQDELNNQQALFAAQSLVTKAEGTLSKSDYDKATSAVGGLRDTASKNELETRLQQIANQVNAVAAVVKAEQSRQQPDIDAARVLVNKLDNGQLKTDLITRLNRIDTALSAAIAKVQQAEATLTQASVDAAQTAINVLTDSPDKTTLQTRLDAVKKQIADKAYQAQLLAATAKVVQAETYKRDPYVTDAWTLVNALPAGADKDGLVARLNTLAQSNQDQANADQLAKATAKVQQAETYKRDPYLTDAWTLVNALSASADKDALIDRLNAIVSSGTVSPAVQLSKATSKVQQAETYKRDPYLTDAWTLVNALPASADKDSLVDRLNAIVPSGTVSPAVQLSKATAKVQQAETYKRDPYITDAWTLVNALSASSDKDALVQRLNAISSGTTTPTDPALESAQNYVAIYEKYKTSYYKTKAQNAVNALPDGADKTALQARIDAVV